MGPLLLTAASLLSRIPSFSCSPLCSLSFCIDTKTPELYEMTSRTPLASLCYWPVGVKVAKKYDVL